MRRSHADSGSAVLEFLIIGGLVLVPLLYAVLTIMRIEAAAMASTQAVREAGRAFVMADSPSQGMRNAEAAARLALADQGFALPSSALEVTCEGGCLEPSSSAHVRLQWQVDLPWVPRTLGDHEVGYPISAETQLRVDRYRSAMGDP